LVESAYGIPGLAPDEQPVGRCVVDVPQVAICSGAGGQPETDVSGRTVAPQHRAGLLQGAVTRKDPASDRTNRTIGLRCRHQLIDASRLDGAVIVEEKQVPPVCHVDGQVASAGEPEVGAATNEDDVIAFL